MNEVELLRRLVQDPPARDDLAMARARQRLRAEIAAEAALPRQSSRGPRPGHRGLLRLVGVVAVLAVATFTVQLILPSGKGGPSGSAAQELVALGRVAAGGRSLDIPPGSYLYAQVEEVQQQTTTDLGEASAAFTVEVRDSAQSWLGADGSGRRTTTIEAVSFPSPADEQTWRDAGSPPLPKVGSISAENFPYELPFYNVGELPTDPNALLAAIRSGDIGPPPQGDVNLLRQVGSLLAQGNASPQLRQGLFDVAAGLPSVSLDQDATDPIGRPGVGVSLTSGGETAELIFDPASSAILATELRRADGEVANWQAFTDQEIVGSVGVRP